MAEKTVWENKVRQVELRRQLESATANFSAAQHKAEEQQTTAELRVQLELRTSEARGSL